MTQSKTPATIDDAMFPAIADRDPDEVVRRMVARNFKSTTLDELFDAQTGKSSDDLVGKSIEIVGVDWDIYESDKGPMPMAIVDAIDQHDGNHFEFVTTASMLTSFIRQAELINALPCKVRIEGKKTRSGQTALNFVRP